MSSNKFINFIKHFIIIILVIGLILGIVFIAYIFFFKDTNNFSINESITYFQAPNNQIINNSSNNKNDINISFYDDSNINGQNNTMSFTNKFYYNQLDDNGKFIYDSLESNTENLKTGTYVIDFSTKFNSLLHESNGENLLNNSFQSALDAFFYDHPDIFYIDLSKLSLLIKYKSFGPKTTYNVSLGPSNGGNYFYGNFESEEQVRQAINKVENIRNNFIQKSILNTDKNYNKILKVHDVLVNSLEYNSNLEDINNHDIYGALVGKKVVCEGYAKAFKYILDSLNIECILVSGNATNSTGKTEAHMWNYVKLDGKWYAVDVTWDDPIIVGSTSSKKSIRHDYFCKGSTFFNKSHTLSNKISENGKSFSYPSLCTENYNLK